MASERTNTDVSSQDITDLTSLLADIKDKVTDTIHVVDEITKKFSKPFANHGVSFLDMKYHLLLQYLIDLNLLMTRKVGGKRIETHPVVERLVESRTVLEKTRPIDAKLKYIINKFLKASTDNIGDVALTYRPNPENLVSNEGNEDNKDTNTSQQGTEGVYVPPKIAAVPYEDPTVESRKRKILERSRNRALNSSLLKDLRDEYSEQPEEINDGYKGLKLSKIRMKEETREKYEEENLMRLPTTKKERQLMRLKGSGLSDLMHFDSKRLKSFDVDEGDDDEFESYKRKKKDFGKKGKKKRGFKGGKHKKRK